MATELVERLRVLADGEPAYISLTITEAADRIEKLERMDARTLAAAEGFAKQIGEFKERIEKLELELLNEQEGFARYQVERKKRIEELERAAWRVIGTQDVGDLGDAMRELERVVGNP